MMLEKRWTDFCAKKNWFGRVFECLILINMRPKKRCFHHICQKLSWWGKIKGTPWTKSAIIFFQVSYEHDSQCVLMLIDERCWRILNEVHRTFFRKIILVWLRTVLFDWRTDWRGPQKYGNFPCYFSIKLKNCLSHAIKYYWEAEWYSNYDHYILLDLKKIQIIATCSTNSQNVI